MDDDHKFNYIKKFKGAQNFLQIKYRNMQTKLLTIYDINQPSQKWQVTCESWIIIAQIVKL